MAEAHPVLVVGAGPVGLAAALALRARDLPVVVLEAAPEGRHRPGSRAIFLHRESLEHLEAMRPGLGWDVARRGLVWTTKRTFWREHLVYERTYPPPSPARLPHSTNLSQVDIEAIVFDAAKAAGVEFAWEQEVAAISTSPGGVALRTTRGQEWQAQYVVGADGARSPVREGIGATLEGPRVANSFVIVDVADDPDHPLVPERVYHYEHPAVGGRNVLLVPFAGGVRADLQLRPSDDPARFDDPEEVKAWIARVLPERYADRVTWVSTYRFHQAVADAFTDPHHRVLLAGEAAHLFAPFGARGLNSGIPDALVAARAIRRALDDPAAAAAAVTEAARTRREAALYNRNASNLALRHMQADGWAVRLRRHLHAAIARRGLRSGAWLDSSPFGPRAAEHRTGTGSY
jgi:3-(3-hydroxy-phenyl)propionate hydroxylase